MNRNLTFTVLALWGLLWIAPAHAQTGGQASDATQKAAAGILHAFSTHHVVAIGETHLKQAEGDFYAQLVSNPGFPGTVNAIVVEFGNSLYQPVLDRYIDGQDVPFLELSQVWRNTTQVAGWECKTYQRLLETVRTVNLKLPKEKRIRVLAGDPPIDWSRIHSVADYGAFSDRNTPYVKVIEKEILASGKHALVIMGANHLSRFAGHNSGDVTSQLDKLHPGDTYTISISYADGGNDFSAVPVPFFCPLDEKTGDVAPAVQKLFAGSRKSWDSVLYLGSRGGDVFSTIDDLDAAYIKTIAQRARIVYGANWSASQTRFPNHPRWVMIQKAIERSK